MTEIQTKKTLLEIIGDNEQGEYTLKVDNENIPIYYGKDHTSVYPQIKVSLYDEVQISEVRFLENTLSEYITDYNKIFQIDIYTNNMPLLDNAKDTLVNRIYDFFNLDTYIYDYSDDFIYDEDLGYYINEVYGLNEDNLLFSDVYKVYIDEFQLQFCDNKDDLIDDSYFVNDIALYIKTNKEIENVHVKVLRQGMLFKNKDGINDRGFYYYKITDSRELDDLEDNEVLRKSFNLNIILREKRSRAKIPKADKITHLPKVK